MGCKGCGNGGGNTIPITDNNHLHKGVIMIAGPGIAVEDLSDAENYRFRHSTVEFIALSVALTLIAKESGEIRTSPVLKGTVLDRIELSWVYNKAINSQTLSNTGGLAAPTLIGSDVSHNYDPVNVQNNISFTIAGNDGLGQPGSTDSDTKSISFGNIMWLGKGPSKINTATAGIEAFIETLATQVIKTSRSHTYHATGGVNEKHFVAYPKAFGLATFTKPPFVGGYVRLKNVLGTLKSELAGGDVETDVIFTNSKGYAEAYYIYESLIDNQDDPVTSFTIS
jgi:hypothetical protein